MQHVNLTGEVAAILSSGRRFARRFSSRGGSTSETRKLAAILVFYVVGFSRLTGMNEERLLPRPHSLRTLLDRLMHGVRPAGLPK